jgi:hypothetical protein
VASCCNYGMIMACERALHDRPTGLGPDPLVRGLLLRPRKSLEAENLFLRRQLALYRERGVKPRRVDAATRVTLTLSRWFDWRSALVVVQPETLIRWHRAGFRLWWRWNSRPGRPSIRKSSVS